MLNYIIPPIIVIIGLILFVYLLFRKMDELPPEEILKFKEVKIKKENKLKSLSKFLWQLLLKFLEKIVQRFKIYSMRFHNCCQNWFQSIKEKREANIVQREFDKKQEKKNKEELVIEGNAEEKSPVVKRITTKEIQIQSVATKKVILSDKKEKKLEDSFEQALIDRIAVNPQDIEAYERLGDYYLENNNYEESLECFQYVLKLSPLHYKAKIRTRRLKKMLGK